MPEAHTNSVCCQNNTNRQQTRPEYLNETSKTSKEHWHQVHKLPGIARWGVKFKAQFQVCSHRSGDTVRARDPENVKYRFSNSRTALASAEVFAHQVI